MTKEEAVESVDKDCVERLLQYAKETGIKETIMETRGEPYWLKRGSDGACTFLR